MKKLLLVLFAFHYLIAFAFQEGPDQVKNIDGKNYRIYKVQAGDGWYGIARKFNMTYSELRVANKNSDDKLFPGKEILIPADKLKANDPYFEKNHLDNETTIQKKSPQQNSENKYHIVAPAQTLFSISKIYGVSVDQIKTWNNLSSNSISKGEKLIVGKAEVLESPVQESILPVKKEVVIQPAVVDVKPKTVTPPASVTQQVSVEEAKTNITEPYDSNVVSENVQKEEISTPPQNEIEASPVKEIDKTPIRKEVPEESVNNSGDKVIFANGRKEMNENGTAVRMEDEDVNQDKYYALHKTAPIGTIIRVMNLTNSRKIYVKVTGLLSDSPENSGVIIKLSKASAEKLGAEDKSFQVNLLFGVNVE